MCSWICSTFILTLSVKKFRSPERDQITILVKPGDFPLINISAGRNHDRIRNAVVGNRDTANLIRVIQYDRTADRQRESHLRRAVAGSAQRRT